MIAYTLSNVLELVPEALPFVKQASLDKEYPLDSRDNCMASALCIGYHAFIDKQSVDPFVMEKVAQALDLYGLSKEATEITAKMAQRSLFQKAASNEDKQAQYLTKQANFEGQRSGFTDTEILAKQAQDLYEEAQRFGLEPSEAVSVYSGNAYLSKEAAVGALQARFHATQDTTFVKLAVAINSDPNPTLSTKTIQDLCQTVTKLDKQAQLNALGFDFYKETLIVKKAAYSKSLRVRVGKEEFPLESILRIPSHHIENYLGKDVAKELKSDPGNAKAVIESLPDDLKQVLLQILKSC